MKKEQALEQLREKLAKAIKDGNEDLRDACKRIIAKLEMAKKSLSDEELITLFITIKKEYDKEIDQIDKYVKNQTIIRDKKMNERNELISSEFFPKLMKEEEIKTELEKIIAEIKKEDDKKVGKIVPKFKELFPAKADMTIVSQIAKELLTK